MKITTFDDLEVYKLAREFRKKMYEIAKSLPKFEEYNLANQMRRASLSVTNNIAEGYGRYHYQENIQFCRQSRGSISELIDDLNTYIDKGYIETKSCSEFKEEAYTLIKVLNSYIASLKRLKDAVLR